MKIIGLAGGTGAGKGTVARLFSKYNFATVDTDDVYHRLTSSPSRCLDSLREAFGDAIIGQDGALDRRALGSIVFADGADEKRLLLNSIAHRFVLDEVRSLLPRLSDEGYAAVLVDAPLLFESGFDAECDSILCITAEKDVRIGRIINRDGISEEAALARIASQMPDEELVSRSDFVIRNNGDLDELSRDVEAIVPLILK